MSYKWPSKNQWLQFFKILTKKEKIGFSLFSILFLASFSFLAIDFYYSKTKIAPARGGSYVEGVIGSPRFINPVYSQISEVDKDLAEIIFSGLMKYDSKGQLVPDIAKEYRILNDGQVYEFDLKEGILWHDGKQLTSDDVIYTIRTIQNPDIKSPLRSVWLGVEIEKISDSSLRFILKNESSIFLENCTLKILPQHIWEDIPAANFSLSPINLNPTGSGPYKLESIFQDKYGKIVSLDLSKNLSYYGQPAFIEKITFKFFETEKELVLAHKRGEIQGFALTEIENIPQNGNIYSFSMPRYFAVFFNTKNSDVLANINVRMALNNGTDKQAISNSIFSGHAEPLGSPILPDIYGFLQPSQKYDFNVEKAKETLEQDGFILKDDGYREKTVLRQLAFTFKSVLNVGSQNNEVTELQKCLAKYPGIYPGGEVTGYFGNKTKAAVIKFQEKYKEEILEPIGLSSGTGKVGGQTIDKLNEICFEKPEEKLPLEFTVSTVDQPSLIKVAEMLKEQWKALGVNLQIKIFHINALESDILRERNFNGLLFGEILGAIPDPFPFWHSSQKGELGLNLANYNNKEVDKLLEDNRRVLDESERKTKLEEFQDILIEDMPAIFLYNPDYIYAVSDEIKGIDSDILIDPSSRFSNINEWYIKTKRIWN
jgi:ABC-type transport system substrate-binding protein